MEVIVLSIHLLVCICLIGLVLLQRSEGGALGIGGGGGGGSLMSGRGASDALAKLTSIAGALFLIVSLGLTWLSGAGQSGSRSIFDDFTPQQSAPVSPAAPAEEPAAEPETAPADPTQSEAPSQSRMASILPGPSGAAAATPPAPGAERAAPISNPPAPPAPAARATVTPAAAPAPAPRANVPAPTAPEPSSPAPALTLQGVDTLDAAGETAEEPSVSESVTVGNGVEAVRRERAGPDR